MRPALRPVKVAQIPAVLMIAESVSFFSRNTAASHIPAIVLESSIGMTVISAGNVRLSEVSL